MYTIFDGVDETGKHVHKKRWIADEDLEAIRNKKVKGDEEKKPDNVFDFRPRFDNRGGSSVRGSESGSRTSAPVAGQVSSSSQFPVHGSLALDSAVAVVTEPVKPLRAVPSPIPASSPGVDFEIRRRARFDNKSWKRSRVKSGLLIKRIAGYDINELEYGINYLKQLPGGKTSADGMKHPHAGFFTWRVLSECGRLVEEEVMS